MLILFLYYKGVALGIPLTWNIVLRTPCMKYNYLPHYAMSGLIDQVDLEYPNMLPYDKISWPDLRHFKDKFGIVMLLCSRFWEITNFSDLRTVLKVSKFWIFKTSSFWLCPHFYHCVQHELLLEMILKFSWGYTP